MAKLSTMIMVTTGMMLLMNLSGIVSGTTGWILGQLGMTIGGTSNFSAAPLYATIIFYITLLIGASSIRIGIFGSPNPVAFATAGAALPLALLVGDLTAIIIQANALGVTWASTLVFLIIAPVLVLYMITLFDWIKGTS